MTPILEQLARYLERKHGRDLGHVRIILPNRRSGLFLQRHLAEQVQGAGWVPAIQPISDLVAELSKLQQGESLEMIIMLYELYCELVEKPDPLEEFYHRGEVMLTDFDEMDKYLVDSGSLFRNVIDLKELEDPSAGLDEFQIAFIRQFWEGFHEGGESREKGLFIQFWELLPKLYSGIRERLREAGTGYQGMLYREVAERIAGGGLELMQEKIVVAGFNALNACEKKLFSWLKNQGAEFFWDYDREYVDDPHSEGGRFMRENLSMFPPPVQLEEFNGLSGKKQIRIFQLPGDVLQAKTLSRILQEEGTAPGTDFTDTAIVLADEELLLPVLTSMPSRIGEINVTMGYPMRNSGVFGFVESLMRLQHNARGAGIGTSFYHRDVSAILLHPFLRGREEASAEQTLKEMTAGNLMHVESGFFKGQLEKQIFRAIEPSGTGWITYLREIFLQLLDMVTREANRLQHELDREFIFRILTHLNQWELILEARPELTASMVERLLRKTISGIRIPFEGEPLAGVQVMGILETRMLDFRHVMLLSMNEELMPAPLRRSSYIPYSLRLAFGMPAREEMDAIYAYYFYRLLQRAEKIDLIYNSGTDGNRTGEMSRYLHQLIFTRDPELVQPGMNIRTSEIKPVSVQHTPSVDRLLDRYRTDSASATNPRGVVPATDGQGREATTDPAVPSGHGYLSPSAINTYMDCSLKFYLRYLAGIGEPDEIMEEIDAAGFGTVVHESIRVLYQEIAGNHDGMLPPGDIDRLFHSSRPEEVLRKTFLDHHFHGRKSAAIEGHNIIALRIMLRYLQKILQTDLGIAPFRLISAEVPYFRNLVFERGGRKHSILMGGKIDRVDRVGDTVRVIDYKTGEVRQQFPTIASLFDQDQNNRNSAAFQTLFYAWLVEESQPGQPLLPGLYGMRALYDPGFDPALYLGVRSEKRRLEDYRSVKESFVEHLQETVAAIFDPERPFAQTENRAKCRVCDFAAICSRRLPD